MKNVWYRNFLLGMPADAPQSAANKFFVVLAHILGFSPGRLLAICNNLEEE
jgi:hypothetical protein